MAIEKEYVAVRTEHAAINYDELKKGGFMRQVQPGLFSVRLRIVGGRVEARQLVKLQAIAEKYGAGHVHLTARQGIEIPFIRLEDADAVRAELSEVGLYIGVCGPTFRTVTACQGREVCPNALADTQEDARRIDAAYFGQSGVPHKFKVGLAGCPNNCTKAAENDLGFMGTVEPGHVAENCSGCGVCAAVCRSRAIAMEDGHPVFVAEKCNGCGECVLACPTGAWVARRQGYAVFVGGKFGREPQIGRRIGGVIDPADLLDVINRIAAFYKEYGHPGERFGSTLNRVGYDKLADEVFGK